MTDEHLVATTPEAPWLPPGSSAEVWAGEDCAPAEPVIIVRLLLSKRGPSGHPEFFCVPTGRGLDLPTRFLGAGDDRALPSEGLALLAHDVLGRSEISTRCVGYVRNVVPTPTDGYPHPTPWAHVPVFVTAEATRPVVDGEWITLDRARAGLTTRHWWRIVERHLNPATTPDRSVSSADTRGVAKTGNGPGAGDVKPGRDQRPRIPKAKAPEPGDPTHVA